jgi:glycosyltransferase involved in cell wall biosynthesis
MKLYEAIACGVPVIASEVPGQVEVIEARGCGLGFPPGQPRHLAQAVAALAETPGLRARLAEAALGTRESDTWDARAGTLIEFVTAVVGGRRAPDETVVDAR